MVSWTSTGRGPWPRMGHTHNLQSSDWGCQIVPWSWDSRSRLIGISQGGRYRRGVSSENQVWEGQNGAMRRRWAPLTFTLHRTAGISFTGGNAYTATGGRMHLCPESSGNLERTRGALGWLLRSKEVHFCLAKQIPNLGYRLKVQHPLSRPEFLSRQRIGRKVQYSRNVNCPQGKELALGRKEKTARKPVQGAWPWTPLTVYVGHYRHIVSSDYYMILPKNGEKMHQSQEDSPDFQAVYVPGKELSGPFPAHWSAFEDRAPARHWCVRRDHMATVIRTHSDPTLEKSGVPPL